MDKCIEEPPKNIIDWAGNRVYLKFWLSSSGSKKKLKRWRTCHPATGISLSATRYLYEQHYKCCLLPNAQINHSCGNSICLNIKHLYTGNQRENMRDKRKHGTTNKGKRYIHLSPKKRSNMLPDHLREEMKNKHATGKYSYRKLAKEYDIHYLTASKIIRPKEKIIIDLSKIDLDFF